MRTRARAVAELVAALVAAAGAVLAWFAARTTVLVPPPLEGEPSTTSVEYSAPLVGLTLLLVTIAGVLAVLGATRLGRRYRFGG